MKTTIELPDVMFRQARALAAARGVTLPLTEIATVTSATADAYAAIRLKLKRPGAPIPPNDVRIAALARQHGFAVLSNDDHFDIVNGLKRIAF